MSQLVYITTEPDPKPKTLNVLLEPPKSQTNPNWLHPHLSQTTDATKGRQFRNTSDLTIPKGELLLIDAAYALIPVVDNPATNEELRCSNPSCHRPCLQHGRCACLNVCIDDVSWCSEVCRERDQLRHGFECTWLKRYAGSIRSKWGEYTFGMVWVIVRLLANRHQRQHRDNHDSLKGDGWLGIDALCGSVHTWPHEQVRFWTTLVKKYLQDRPILAHGLTRDRILHLICQEEANSFGLYPRETGLTPPSDLDRGEQFAAAVYPTAAIANHSCLPNISHKPDNQGRMVFTASRDIHPGEECCIAYFDLPQFRDLAERRDHLRRSFRFVCRCEKCLAEEPAEGEEWTMPLMDDE